MDYFQSSAVEKTSKFVYTASGLKKKQNKTGNNNNNNSGNDYNDTKNGCNDYKSIIQDSFWLCISLAQPQMANILFDK